MRKFRCSQVAKEWVIGFLRIWAIQIPCRKRSKWVQLLYGRGPAKDETVRSSYCWYWGELYSGTQPALLKRYGELAVLLQTAAGKQIVALYNGSLELINTAYPGDYIFTQRRQTALLSRAEEEDLDQVIATLDELWLSAHIEADMLTDDVEARRRIAELIIDAKAHIAALEEVLPDSLEESSMV